jgi:hypothetical protein
MVCYVPGTSTLAVLGFAVYLVWHRAIMHFLSMVGIAMEVTLLLSTEVAVAIFLIWTARMIRRRRAAAGACTTCRFRCQEAMASRPNFFVNRVDRRVGPPPPVRRAALTCHPAAPILPFTPFRAGRRVPARHAAVPSAVPAPGRRGAALPGPRLVPRLVPVLSWRPRLLGWRPRLLGWRPRLLSWRRTPLLNWRRTPLLNWQGIPLHGSRHALTRPAVAPPAAPARPWPAAAAADQWSLTPGETVAFDGYVLTPDGVDAPPDPVRDPHS